MFMDNLRRQKSSSRNMTSIAAYVAVVAMVIGHVQSQNLLQNADMESTNYTGNWYGMGGTISPSNDAFQGQQSIRVYNRQQRWNGVAQNVNLQGGSVYKITAYVKLLGTAGNAQYQDVEMMVACTDSAGTRQYLSMGTTPRMLPSQWYQVGGVELIKNGLAGSNLCSVKVDVELKQTKMEFPFGSAVDARKIVDSVSSNYQEAFYDNFEWGVVENDLKWSEMERIQGQIDYATPITAMDAMRSREINLRCHTVFWGVDANGIVQDWVKALSVEGLKSAIDRRIQGVISATKGKCKQWDVNNEMLHGDFYERSTLNPRVTEEMFRKVQAVDASPTLFLNDYEVLSSQKLAVAIKDLALKYKAAGVPIGGIGAQSHLYDFDIRLLKGRLDILQEAGLPVMITELGINNINEEARAVNLADTLTLMFSHPSVQGIIFWGFWDGHIWEKDAPLFNGNNVTANAAGKAYQQLFQKTWRTNETRSVQGLNVVNVRGFKGTYQMNVKLNGRVIGTSFILGKSGQAVTINISRTRGRTFVSSVTVG